MSQPQPSPLHPLILSGAPEGFDARLLAREVARGQGGAPGAANPGPGVVIHVARDDKRLEAMRAALAFFAPSLPVLTLPAWDCLPYDRMSPNPEISAQRLAVLAHLARRRDAGAAAGGAAAAGGFVLLTTLNAATQRLPRRAIIRDAAYSARVGGQVDEAGLRAWLVRMGFSQCSTVQEPGDYALRGGIIDVFPPGQSGPVRLDLFGDVLDGARRFDPASQRTIETLAQVDLAPVSEVILDEPAITRFRQNYRIEFGAAGADDPLYEAVSAGRKHAGVEHWLPFFHDGLETLFDYLPDATVMLDDQLEPARRARWESIADQYDSRREALLRKDRVDSPYKPCPPGLLYLDDAAWAGALQGRRLIQLSVLPQPVGLGVLDAGARLGRNFAPERQLENVSLFKALADHLQQRAQQGAVVVASYSDGARERLAGLLQDEGLGGAKLIADMRDIPEAQLAPAGGQGGGGLYLAVLALEQGFEAEGLTLVSEQDVLGERLIRPAKKSRRAKNFLTEAQSLSQGDLVVHVEHGVGRYRGLETLHVTGHAIECVWLEYQGGDRLYLPVVNIELLSRYGHEEGLLDKLGGGAWQAKKAALKERIRLIAEKLMRVAAERHLRAAPILAAPDHDWQAFCARFPWSETDDQLSAIADVAQDLESGTPMDRLVVGDVGFGKTEVAMRAAFIAAMSGVQVAVIAPTTLLARQHYRTFAERFRGTAVVVRPLSRFVSARDANATREGLAEGTVDIVIGTHAVLAKSVRFRKLGLMVIDEEQHFGVAHKERLKEMRSDIHVLTLTATPIPRTLQLSLTGVRDLSIIGTPPVDRLAIRTYVGEFDTVTLREALLRERFRGGQSFVVVPRITDLAELESFLADHVPEVRFVTAHGQMAAGDLDERMNAFYDGKFDVLLATTIVESGLDIPTANTMIVHRADMFGLSQLYQIRGRVGRSKTRAYCYLTHKPRVPLTPAAAKRLRLLGSLDSLGAGFSLASQDLDLRGAGNLLGEEQSGHIREVGYELYQAMLEDTIARLKSGEIDATALADDDQWAPQINLGVPVLIPEEYIPDLDIRLGLYRRLSQLTTKVELEGFAAELIDRFGPLPREVNTLMLVIRIKAMCKRAGIAKLDAGPKGATVMFHNDKFANPAGLVAFVHGQGGGAKIKDNKLVLARDWQTEAERIKGAFAIARDLAETLVEARKGAGSGAADAGRPASMPAKPLVGKPLSGKTAPKAAPQPAPKPLSLSQRASPAAPAKGVGRLPPRPPGGRPRSR